MPWTPSCKVKLSLAPISCVSVSGYMECGCPDPDTCGLRAVWKQARDAVAQILDGTTFADIRAHHERLSAAGHGDLVECLLEPAANGSGSR